MFSLLCGLPGCPGKRDPRRATLPPRSLHGVTQAPAPTGNASCQPFQKVGGCGPACQRCPGLEKAPPCRALWDGFQVEQQGGGSPAVHLPAASAPGLGRGAVGGRSLTSAALARPPKAVPPSAPRPPPAGRLSRWQNPARVTVHPVCRHEPPVSRTLLRRFRRHRFTWNDFPAEAEEEAAELPRLLEAGAGGRTVFLCLQPRQEEEAP